MNVHLRNKEILKKRLQIEPNSVLKNFKSYNDTVIKYLGGKDISTLKISTSLGRQMAPGPNKAAVNKILKAVANPAVPVNMEVRIYFKRKIKDREFEFSPKIKLTPEVIKVV